ncbi:hypothetical protein [Helicobacter pylori]|uniref:hypothetical protein n=1 Tax=Helicobacter pylori TaxID=210 RepID=UPI00117B5493|nr:hypothetical protein [Helicobacter pylori]
MPFGCGVAFKTPTKHHKTPTKHHKNPTKKANDNANGSAIATYTPPTLSLPTHRQRYRYLHTANAIATYTANAIANIITIATIS